MSRSYSGNTGASRNGSRRRSKNPPPRRQRGLVKAILPLVLVVSVLLGVGVAGVYGYRWVVTNFNFSSEQSDYPGPGTGEVLFEVHKGDTGTKIAQNMVKADVIAASKPFIALFANSPEAQKIAPGTYRLKKQMSSDQALQALLSPESRAGKRVTIPEGMRSSDMYARLAKQTGIPVEDFVAAAKDYRALGVPENPAHSAEGYFFPSTYDIEPNMSAKDILAMMVAKNESVRKELKISPEKWHEALTIAAIVEKEARDPEDYPKVTRVIENRLTGAGAANGVPMKLQLDSTVAYANNIKNISTTPQQRAIDSPYNTYRYEGLPIGPIANPGAQTLKAYQNPADGKWLFWVTVNTDTGLTKFAETAAEHEKNVQEWRNWAANKRK
ncbi:endolytic transglycosylase MltG [Dermabacteraceae bacterium P7006]